MKSLIPLILTIAASCAKTLPLEVVRNTAREINEVLMAGQKAKGIRANPIADDPTFVRRSYLNIIGRLPTHDEARSFLESTEKEKRSQLIDSLVESPGFNSRLISLITSASERPVRSLIWSKVVRSSQPIRTTALASASLRFLIF